MPRLKQKLLTLSTFAALLLLLPLGLVFLAIPTQPLRIVIVAATAWIALVWLIAMQIKRQAQVRRKIQLALMLLREQDFSIRLSRVGHPEVDQVSELFNALATKLKADRLRLNEQGYFLQNLIQSSPLAIVQLDYDYNITALNAAALDLLGDETPDRIIGLHVSHPDVPFPFELSILESGQSRIVRNASASIYRYTWSSFRDRGFTRPFLTIEILTEAMLEAERKTYSKFVRLCAHEVNNATGSINSIIDTTLEYLQQREDASLYHEALTIAQQRMQALSLFIERVASMVKIPPPELQPTDIAKMLHALQVEYDMRYARRGINVCMHIQEPAPTLLVDCTLFHQVLENIIRNAAQSITSSGTITLSFECDPQWQIIIADNGVPIPKETEPLLFTPFYTTKPNGQGLGLLLCHEILRAHRFNFRLSTEPDGITRFRIYVSQAHIVN